MEASRPRLPDRPEYGAPANEHVGRPVDWETVSDWLERARYYWLCTSRSDGRPHAIAVWAVWSDGRLYFTTSPETVTARILARNPHAVVHLESASEVAIVEGAVRRLAAGEVPRTVVDEYAMKYAWRIDPADEGMPYFVLGPRSILAWRLPDLRGSAVRWRF